MLCTQVDLGQADNCFVGRKAYFFELLRMLPEELVPKPAALPAADDLLVDDASDASDAADEEDDAGPAKEEMKADSLAEAFDSHRQAWSIAKVRQVQADQVMLHYVGWPNTFDSWFHRTEHADQMRPLSGKGTLGPYLQLGLTKASKYPHPLSQHTSKGRLRQIACENRHEPPGADTDLVVHSGQGELRASELDREARDTAADAAREEAGERGAGAEDPAAVS